MILEDIFNTSGPQPFWHQEPVSWKTIFPQTGPGGGGGESGDSGSDGNVSNGERWGAANETSLTRPPLTSRCAGWFLTGQSLSAAQGSGTPVL